MAVLGTVKLVAYGFVPRDYAACNGQLLAIDANPALFSILGVMYGGNGRTTFGLPNLQTRVPLHRNATHQEGATGGAVAVNLNTYQMPEHSHPVMATTDAATATSPEGHVPASGGRGAALYAPESGGTLTDLEPDSITAAGGGQAHNNMQPSLGLHYVICTNGDYPSRSGGALPDEGQDYMADIKTFGFGFAPRGWATCEGQLLPINQYQSLYSLLGTTYGGDGQTTFALPDLRGRAAVGEGSLSGVEIALGLRTGQESVTLKASEIPSHYHQGQAIIADPSSPTAEDMLPAGTATNPGPFTDGKADKAFDGSVIGVPSPNGQPHDNMMPYLTVSFCICLNGLFPSRN